jgi:hypothetical protein
MHAMLALSSLHIAKLHGESMVPSMKHYHKALQWVAKWVSDPHRRGQVATLAATMLLGYWEVMAAEHNKWNSHLLGARQLIVEIDFVALSQRMKARRVSSPMTPQPEGIVSANLQQHAKAAIDAASPGSEGEYRKTVALTELLMGQKAPTQQPTSSRESYASPHTIAASPTQSNFDQEIEDKVRTDLFWWFLKQDLYQSILSNNPLL